ncbi:TSUP family transporter, partial [Caulobacter sp. 17J65-9]|uniref:TSUP family transporter n=1 Tax=Caulobacter sp. 17J65-9 TaxID=2709382 RepID=UPI0013C5B493
ALSSTSAFARRGLIDWRAGAPMALAAAVAGLAGAASVSHVPREALSFAVPIVLIGIAVYFAFARKLGDADARARLGIGAFTLAFVPVIGFYDGVFGPGAGSFYMIGFITLLGWGVVRATAHTKLANCASNLGALSFFIASGGVVWSVGLTMAAGAFLGAQIGSRLAMKHGARLIRPLLVVICCAMAAKLLSDPANPLRVAVEHLIGG